jgi:hypothetical protein
MATNPILDEIHQTRKDILAEYGGDIHAYVEDARRRTLESGRPIAPPKRRNEPGESESDDQKSIRDSQ